MLADAFVRALEATGIRRDQVDGLGVASFTLVPDRAIDLAWKLGLRPRWLMDDGNGGVQVVKFRTVSVQDLGEIEDPGAFEVKTPDGEIRVKITEADEK